MTNNIDKKTYGMYEMLVDCFKSECNILRKLVFGIDGEIVVCSNFFQTSSDLNL